MYYSFKLLPGEHLSSFIGRYHREGTQLAFHSTVKALNLKNKTVRPYRFFTEDDFLLNDRFNQKGVDNPWFKHSFGNYLWPFLNRKEQCTVNERLNANESITLKMKGERLLHGNHWRWCVECNEEDTETYGSAYYHCKHQLPGVYHCYKHGIGLSGQCDNCGYSVKELSQQLIPPRNNACPECGFWMVAYDGYFSDGMKSIEEISTKLASQCHQSGIELFTNEVQKIIGIENLDRELLTTKRQVSAWYADLARGLDQKALSCYFNKSEPYGDFQLPVLFRDPRLLSLNTHHQPLSPLVYLVIMNYIGLSGFTVDNSFLKNEVHG